MFRLRSLATAGVAAAALCLAVPLTASAQTGGTFGTRTGQAGYFINALGTNYRSLVSTLDITPNAVDIGPGTNGAIGQRLCNNASGKTAGMGIQQNASQGTFSLLYTAGTLKANGGDPCIDNGILSGTVLHPLLTGLQVGQAVTIQEVIFRHDIVFAATEWGGPSNGRSFSAELSCGAVKVWYWTGQAHHRHHRFYWRALNCPTFNEPEVGVQQDLSLVGGPATNDLVDFAGVYTDTVPTWSPSIPFGAYATGGMLANQGTLFALASSGTGTPPWLVGPARTGTTGPNGEGCLASQAFAGPPPLTAGGPQYGPLTDSTTAAFTICSATNIGA